MTKKLICGLIAAEIAEARAAVIARFSKNHGRATAYGNNTIGTPDGAFFSPAGGLRATATTSVRCYLIYREGSQTKTLDLGLADNFPPGGGLVNYWMKSISPPLQNWRYILVAEFYDGGALTARGQRRITYGTPNI